MRAFCRLHDLSEPSMYGWRRTLAQRDADTVRFVPVAIEADEETAAAGSDGEGRLELVLHGGRCLRIAPGFDADTLRQVLAVLEEQRIPYVPPPQELIGAADKGQVPLLMPSKSEGLDDANIPYQLLPAYLERDAQRARVAALIKLHNSGVFRLFFVEEVA